MELFNMQENQDSEIWLNYVAFIDALIEDALFKTIAVRYVDNLLQLDMCLTFH